MRFFEAVLFLLPVVGVFAEPKAHPPHPPNPGHGNKGGFKHLIPSRHESAILARRMLRKAEFATISTVFPGNPDGLGTESVPKDVAGLPIGMIHYYADCVPEGNPITLGFDIATTFKNAAAGSNVSLSLDWGSLFFHHGPHGGPPHGHKMEHTKDNDHKHSPVPPAALPRFSILGHLELIEADQMDSDVRKCYLDHHPDSARLVPGNRVHTTRWAKVVVEKVYWVGGFGNVAYIGWISGDEWRSVTEEEIDRARLPGELPPPHDQHHGHHPCSGPISGLRRVASGLAGCVQHNEHVCPIPIRVVEAGVVAGWAFFVLALVFVPLSQWIEKRREAQRLTIAASLREVAERAQPASSPIEAADDLEKKALLSDHK